MSRCPGVPEPNKSKCSSRPLLATPAGYTQPGQGDRRLKGWAIGVVWWGEDGKSTHGTFAVRARSSREAIRAALAACNGVAATVAGSMDVGPLNLKPGEAVQIISADACPFVGTAPIH